MVCKEDVLSWFKELESYERIDLLYQLLNMCLPWELRFIGTCVEEAGKHTYQELRGPTISANDVDRLTKDAALAGTGGGGVISLLDDTARHRCLLYLSLLSSRNCAVANWLYTQVLRTERTREAVQGAANAKDDNFLNECLLLFTMALHHPAFTFEQKLYFGEVLGQLLKLKEARQRRYPPGFVPHKHLVRSRNSIDESSTTVPVKTSLTMTYGDTLLHQHPPGLPQVAPMPHQTHMEYMWSRPGFPCGPPEMSSFPAPAISPLVSRATSPSHSRSSSPHRTPLIRGPLPPMPPLEVAPPPAGPPPLEGIPQPSLPHIFANELKLPDDELSSVRDEKQQQQQLAETPWVALVPSGVVDTSCAGGPPKHHLNGLRFPATACKLPQPFIVDQMRALSMEGEGCLHHSNNSSSNSSPAQTPPDTPSLASGGGGPHHPHHAPPQEAKPRVNGMPVTAAPFVSMCEPFSNCTVPYSYPLISSAAAPPRSIYQYNHHQAYRPQPPPFTAHFPPAYAAAATADSASFPAYTPPYVPLVYSSPAAAAAAAVAAAASPPPPYPTRSPNCYNCGAAGHLGPDCTGQTIEDITQKKGYSLEYSPPPLLPQQSQQPQQSHQSQQPPDTDK